LIRVRGLEIPTLDDVDLSGVRVLMRIDVNSPVDPGTGRITDNYRFRAHVSTVRELLEKGNSVVLISHQGRPGDRDFRDLGEHAGLLSGYLGVEVEFVEDVSGPHARQRIKGMRAGEVILLDNLRFSSEEMIEASPQDHASSYLVRRLSPMFQGYINDAFSASHRSHASLVGFPVLLKSCAGRVVEREISAAAEVLSPHNRPRVFVIGGGKVAESLRAIEGLMRRGLADRILTGGLLAEVFTLAKGVDLGRENIEVLARAGALGLLGKAKELLRSGTPVEVPVDFKVERGGEVSEVQAEVVEGVIRDVGPSTVDLYSALLREAGTIVLRGPMGVIEDQRFRESSSILLRESITSGAYVIVGGGHMVSLLDKGSGLDRRKVHVSTGGGALLLFLLGERMPGLEALSMRSGGVP